MDSEFLIRAFLFSSCFLHLPVHPSFTEREAELLRIVREQFLDAKVGSAWAERHHGLARSVQTESEFVRKVRKALQELKTSHTGYFTPDDPEYAAIRAIFSEGATSEKVTYDSAGADLTEDGFVRVVFAGGPGIKAGLRRGDRVIAVDGKPFHRVASFRGKAGQEVKLQVLRQERQQPCEMRLTPRRISPKDEWLSAQRIGSCLLAHEKTKKKILYVPMYSCAGREFADLLRDTLMEKGSEADGLVLDLRNGWGGCNPELVQLFQGNPPVLTYVGRDGTQRKIDSRWRKPLVVLINQGSRSGKEVVASSIKKHKLGVLVGKTTAGAVVGGRPFFLQGEAILYLAVQDVRVDGVRLEGVGVAPDVEVPDQLEYGEGRDPQLQKALELAGMSLAR